MSLAIQFNINDLVLTLDGDTELVAPSAGGLVTKSVNAEGVVIIDAAAEVGFGAFDPGSLLGSRSGDFVLQSMQISSAGTFTGGDVALIGPQPPGAVGSPFRFVFHTLSGANDLFTGGQVVPTGYKLSFSSDAAGPHVVRLSLWPITRLEQVAAILGF